MTKKKEPELEKPETWKDAPKTFTVHPDDAELDDVLTALPQNEACIDLFRVNPQGGRPLFLESVQPSVFTLAYVTGKFGGGRYTANAKYISGDRVKTTFDIEGEPIPVRRFGPGGGAEPIHSPQAAQIQALLHQAPAVDEFVAPPSDMAGMFSVLITLIKDMKSSKADMYKEMLMMKELFGSNNQPTGPQATVDQVTGMLMKGIELAGKAGGPVETNVWLEVARELKDPLAKAFDALQMAIATRGQTPTPQPAVIPAQAAPTQPQSTTTGEPLNLQIVNQLRMVLPLLVNGASKNADPEGYADFILDQTQENLYPSLRDWLIKPDCLDMLAKIEPGIRYAQEWWIELRTCLISKLTEEVGNGLTNVQSPENPEPTTGGPSPGNPAA